MSTEYIYDIIEELASDDSRKSKERVLTKHKDDELLKHVFQLTLSQFINFYQKKIPDFTPSETTLDLRGAIGVLTMLSDRKVTGNDAVALLADTLSKLSEKDAEIVTRIVRRNLKCGVSESTVNKVFGKGTIKVIPFLLCEAYSDKVKSEINFAKGAYCEKKEDGVRFSAVVNGNSVTYYLRSGLTIEFPENHLAEQFTKLAGNQKLVFDGELLVANTGHLADKSSSKKYLPRKKGNGVINRFIKGKGTTQDSELIHCVVWDVIPMDNWVNESYDVLYEDRDNMLQDIFTHNGTNLPNIHIKESSLVFSWDEAMKKYQKYLDEKDEGVIIKDRSLSWGDIRSKKAIKLKSEKEINLRVIGWNYGEVGGKYEKVMGSLTCATEDGKVVVNISGWTAEEHNTLTPENTIGRIVHVIYNERISSDKNETDSLFLPRVDEFIEDRTEADTEDKAK